MIGIALTGEQQRRPFEAFAKSPPHIMRGRKRRSGKRREWLWN